MTRSFEELPVRWNTEGALLYEPTRPFFTPSKALLRLALVLVSLPLEKLALLVLAHLLSTLLDHAAHKKNIPLAPL